MCADDHGIEFLEQIPGVLERGAPVRDLSKAGRPIQAMFIAAKRAAISATYLLRAPASSGSDASTDPPPVREPFIARTRLAASFRSAAG